MRGLFALGRFYLSRSSDSLRLLELSRLNMGGDVRLPRLLVQIT